MTIEDDSIDQATSARRERLRVLRAAKEYASMPDVDADKIQISEPKQEFMAGKHEVKVYPARKAKTFEEDSAGPNNTNGKDEDNGEAEKNEAPNMKFRNYLPHDKHLQEGKLPAVDLPKFEDPIAPVQHTSDKIEDPFLNIAPKKPNWDLRRDVQKKLDKLERRTQKALYELMLEQEKENAAKELENAGNAD